MREFLFLERLASPKILFILVVSYLIAMFFIANFLLSFLQEVLQALKQFADGSENVTFDFSWAWLFIYQHEYNWFYVGFYAIVFIGLVKFVYNIKLSFSSLNKGQHGTGEFEKVKEMKKQYKIIPAAKTEYDGHGGVIIAGLNERFRPYRVLIDESPVHTMVIGITRSGKGETFVFPMLDVLSRAKEKPSLVVNDPKGELVAASYDTLIERGYEVQVFNLLQQHMGMGFNPLQLVVEAWKKGNTSLAQQYANSVAHSLYYDPNAKDPFWNNSAKSLVTAIILALTEDAIATGKEEKVNMYSVANFLATLGSDNDEEGNNALDQFFQARDENNPARMMYATSNFASGNTRSSIFSTAMDKLQIFTLEPNAKLTGYNSLNLTDVGFGDKPVAIFMVVPDFDSSNHVLASIFVSQLYRVNAEKATMSEGGKMKRHVHFLLDEFGNMPTVEGMASMVTVGAGRGFRFHLIVQAYSQLKTLYGNEAETIIGNCSNQIYILTEDENTAKQFSALVGTKTIPDISRSGKLFSSDKSHSESVKERPLLMPDELMRLKSGESVVVRVNKRHDLKGRKIVPKPIYNRGVTAHKFRYEYLADDFDNRRSVLELPIMSNTYHDLVLSEMVITAKTEQDQFLKIKDVLSKDAFMQLRDQLRDLLPEVDVDNWTFLHLLSYLTYETEISPEAIVIRELSQYLPNTVIESWKKKIEKEREKQHQKLVESYQDKGIKDREIFRRKIIGEGAI